MTELTPQATGLSAIATAQESVPRDGRMRGGPRSGESARAYKARRRMRLFIRQGGRCHYCHCDLVMAPDGQHCKQPPDNLATIEHLRDRFHPERTEPNPGRERRWVLACRACNNRVGAERQAEVPLDELHRRARNGHNSFVTRTRSVEVELDSETSSTQETAR